MSVRTFIDTNIFIYAQRTDCPAKRQIAESTLDYFDCVASTQVLNEVANVFTKKYPIPIEKVVHLIKSICEVSEIVVVDESLVEYALDLHNRYKLSYYDCLMIASAIYSGCRYLITEDMHDGLLIEGNLTLVNIFSCADMFLP